MSIKRTYCLHIPDASAAYHRVTMPKDDLTPNAGQQTSMAPWGCSRRVSN
jgi:hypothetical protein